MKRRRGRIPLQDQLARGRQSRPPRQDPLEKRNSSTTSGARRRLRRLGLTYLEALWTLMLVAMIFFMFTQLLREGLQVMRATDSQAQSLQACSVGLDRLACELREAYTVDLAAGQVTLTKVDPTRTDRLPESYPTPAPDPANYQPMDETYRLKVRYSLRDGRLTREVGPLNAPPEASMVVAENVAGFEGTRTAPKTLTVQLSLRRDRLVQPLRATVVCPCLP